MYDFSSEIVPERVDEGISIDAYEHPDDDRYDHARSCRSSGEGSGYDGNDPGHEVLLSRVLEWSEIDARARTHDGREETRESPSDDRDDDAEKDEIPEYIPEIPHRDRLSWCEGGEIISSLENVSWLIREVSRREPGREDSERETKNPKKKQCLSYSSSESMIVHRSGWELEYLSYHATKKRETEKKKYKENNREDTIIVSIESESPLEIGGGFADNFHGLECYSLFSHDEIATDSGEIPSDPVEERHSDHEYAYEHTDNDSFFYPSSAHHPDWNQQDRDEESDDDSADNIDSEENQKWCEVLFPFWIEYGGEGIL